MVVGFPIYNHTMRRGKGSYYDGSINVRCQFPEAYVVVVASSQDSCIDEAEARLELITDAVQCRYCDESCCRHVTYYVVMY